MERIGKKPESSIENTTTAIFQEPRAQKGPKIGSFRIQAANISSIFKKRSHVTFARSFKLQAESADLISPIFETETRPKSAKPKNTPTVQQKQTKSKTASFTIALIHSVKRRR